MASGCTLDSFADAQVNETSKRSEYQGEVMTVASGMADLPFGGQILMDDKTFDGVKTSLADLVEKIPRRPNWDALQMLSRYSWRTRELFHTSFAHVGPIS